MGILAWPTKCPPVCLVLGALLSPFPPCVLFCLPAYRLVWGTSSCCPSVMPADYRCGLCSRASDISWCSDCFQTAAGTLGQALSDHGGHARRPGSAALACRFHVHLGRSLGPRVQLLAAAALGTRVSDSMCLPCPVCFCGRGVLWGGGYQFYFFILLFLVLQYPFS